MRKVTTINLNNNAYQIDDDAYEALRRYLEGAERALAGNPDRAEIMADLEQAIADKCRQSLGSHKSVVSLLEIERILQQMGPVAGDPAGPGAADAQAPGNAAASPGAPAQPRRRLYRIPDGEKWTLTGVCNGLAAYAAVERDWVRVAFVLLTVFTGGLWLVVYFALVFLMPVATTPEELAAAHGRPFSAQELVDRAKRQSEDLRAERSARRMHRQSWFDPRPASHQPAPGPAARVAGSIALPLLTLLSALWFAAMALAALLMWDLWQSHGPRWPDHWQWHDLPRWLGLIFVLAAYLLIAMPIAAGRRAALYYANGGHRHGWANAWSGLLWLVVVSVILIVAWHSLPQLQDFLQLRLHWPVPASQARWI